MKPAGIRGKNEKNIRINLVFRHYRSQRMWGPDRYGNASREAVASGARPTPLLHD